MVSVPAEVLNSSGLLAAKVAAARERAQSNVVILMQLLYAVAALSANGPECGLPVLVLSIVTRSALSAIFWSILL